MAKYYAFLDVVVDVFYSIILYNAFISFSGFNMGALLLGLLVFIMLNYWWSARSVEQVPKYYLFDFYFISAVMFIFSQMPQYLLDVRTFLYWLTGFFALDCIYSLTSIWAHWEKAEEPLLWFYVKWEASLFVVYLLESFLIRKLNFVTFAFILAPYLLWFVVSIKEKKFAKKFVDTGKEPY